MRTVYALYNREADKLYIGETDNLVRRVKEHNSIELNKGHFTSKFPGVWELVYQEELPNRKEALRREKELKRHKGRDFLREQVNIPE